MSRRRKGIVVGSKVGVRPSPKTLDAFMERGGYALLESIGKGETPRDKQLDGWNRFGVVRRLQKKTGISRPTLHRIRSWFPTVESTGMPNGIWIGPADYENMKEARSRLKHTDKLLKQVQKYFKRSMIVDFGELRVRQQLLGESIQDFQLALKQQAEADERKESRMERVLDDAITELGDALRILYISIP